MSELVFLLEEPSAREMLRGLLAKLLPPGWPPSRYIVFEGKQDLERRLVRRIRGYHNPQARFIILRDQDSGDCRTIKTVLKAKCFEAVRPETAVRIACKELESWYLGDLAAAEEGLEATNVARLQGKAKYRNPDTLESPAQELLRLVPAYQKVAGSRAIGPFLDPDRNRSHSFGVFIRSIRDLVSRGIGA